jgi:hypothetical protein
MNRRDLLKFFGVGAIAVPLAADEPMVRLVEPLKLVAPPKVEVVQAGDLNVVMDLSRPVHMTIILRQGQVTQTLNADKIKLHATAPELLDVTVHGDSYISQFVPSSRLCELRWEMSGVFHRMPSVRYGR